MSTIVVVKKNGVACIAADTLTSFGCLNLRASLTQGQSKIIKVDETYIGITGSCAHKLVLESYFSDPDVERGFSSRKEIFETWRKLHQALKQEYYLNSSEDKEDPYETTRIHALLLNSYGIFGIYQMRSVDDYAKFWAIGSGQDFALGSMLSTYESLNTAEEIAKTAVMAAAEFDDGTGMPVEVFSVELGAKSLNLASAAD
jgi:ATP-dependent HslUV protease, peptidase subunit HslV